MGTGFEPETVGWCAQHSSYARSYDRTTAKTCADEESFSGSKVPQRRLEGHERQVPFFYSLAMVGKNEQADSTGGFESGDNKFKNLTSAGVTLACASTGLASSRSARLAVLVKSPQCSA